MITESQWIKKEYNVPVVWSRNKSWLNCKSSILKQNLPRCSSSLSWDILGSRIWNIKKYACIFLSEYKYRLYQNEEYRIRKKIISNYRRSQRWSIFHWPPSSLLGRRGHGVLEPAALWWSSWVTVSWHHVSLTQDIRPTGHAHPASDVHNDQWHTTENEHWSSPLSNDKSSLPATIMWLIKY